MRGAFIMLACAALLAAQEPRSEDEPSPAEKREKRIAALLDEIEGIAGVEPPQIAIDSLIRTARTIRSSHPERASKLMESARERLAGLRSGTAKAGFASLLGQAFSEFDPQAAEEICQSIAKELPEEFESDPKSSCWATRIARESKPAARLEASLRAISDGAFSTTEHATTMGQLQKTDPEAAASFLSAYLAGFPEKSAGLPELKGLIQVLKAAGAEQPQLSRQLLETAVRSVERKDFPEPKRTVQFESRLEGRSVKTSGARESLSFQLADLAWVLAPDLLESHPDSLGKWKADVSSGDWQRRRITRFREVEPSLDAGLRKVFGVDEIPGTPADFANPQATRRLLATVTDPNARLLIQTQLLAEGNIPETERAEFVKELLETMAKAPPRSRLRTLVLFFLIDNSLDREDRQAASEFAKQLAAAFDSSMACPEVGCEESAVIMQPGELATEFLSYLDRRKLEPAALGLGHPTLTLRLRLAELGRLVEEAKPKRKPKVPAP